jgi:VWFA-related protein
MKSRIALLLVTALFSFIVSPARLGAQSQQDKQDKDDNLVLRANEVILDVVVRDKKGHAVKDLKPADIEIYEDNVRQDMASFRLVSREGKTETKAGPRPAATAPAPTPAGPREPFSNISLVAMAFDHLSPNGRNLAQKAGFSFIEESLQPDDQVSVCVIDQSLRVVQQYTSDSQLLKQAVERATTMAVSGTDSRAAERRPLEERSSAIDESMSRATGSTGAGTNSGSVGANAVEQALVTMQVRALQTFETLERTQTGQSQINSLLAIINSMQGVPGRKAIVLFSEGLALPPDVKVRFSAVVNAATRANVTVYTVEAGGLRTESGNAEAAREIKSIAEGRTRQLASGREDRSGRPMTMQLERNEDLLKLNPQSGLGELAASTGGFMIADTNDLAAGLRRIDEDLRTHYEVSYVSKNTNLDGRFRQISVKLGRGGLEAQTRKGYLALPPTGSAPVLEYEAPAIAAMYKTSQGGAFPLRSKAFNFPEAQRAGLTTVLAEVPASAFTYTPNADKKTFSTDYTIVTVIRNDAQQVVAKLSKHYTEPGPIEQMEAARRGDILFYKEERLPPGHYAMETAAYDAPSGKVSIRSDAFDVLPSDNAKLRLSSLMLLKRAEQLSPAEQQQDKTQTQINPFHYGGQLLIYPNLGEPIGKAAMKQLPFFFNVYLPQGSKNPPKLAIEVLKSGQHLANIQAQLPAPDGSGLIQFASTIPLDSFQPGNYELKITVSDGASNVARSIAFAVAP